VRPHDGESAFRVVMVLPAEKSSDARFVLVAPVEDDIAPCVDSHECSLQTDEF